MPNFYWAGKTPVNDERFQHESALDVVLLSFHFLFIAHMTAVV